jgi:hypothetical protein
VTVKSLSVRLRVGGIPPLERTGTQALPSKYLRVRAVSSAPAIAVG